MTPPAGPGAPVSGPPAVHALHYRMDGAVRGQLPGSHRSASPGSGPDWRGHASLRDAPDARRLDLHASLRDPFGDWRVRLTAQRSAVPVVVVADLSASMAAAGLAGGQHTPRVLADLVASLGQSAWRSGDRFGFIGCDSVVRTDWLLPPTRVRGAAQALAERLQGWVPAGPSAGAASGLLQAPAWLGRQRALVFLVSDFHLPLAQVQAVLAGLAAHALVPVLLGAAQDRALGTRWGLVQAADAESGRHALLWWRPALRQRWQQWQAQRRLALAQLFAAQGLRPLEIDAGLDADAFNRHFHP